MWPRLAIVAHRGASALAPENTLAAFRAALDLGVAVLETDVRAARDGVLVLSHDEHLSRRAGRPEAIAALDGALLREIAFGTDARGEEQRLPTLDDALRLAAGRARVLLDLKLPDGHESRVLAAILSAGMEGATIAGVRSLDTLRAIRMAAPELPTLAFGRTQEEVWELVEAGADIVRLWSPWTDAAALDRARRLGKPVWVMCGSPSRGDVGETTVAALRDYRRLSVAAAILNDPCLALAVNTDEGEGAL